jgi:nucleotide-sensitive chloride channel 1A
MEALSVRPDESSFVPITEHQAQTPASFFSGPPVLHLLLKNSTVIISKAQIEEHAALRGLQPETTTGDSDVPIPEVDIYVSSQCVLSFK